MRWPFAPAALLVLVLAATAVAQPDPVGEPVAGSVAIAPISFPDPDGGVPWGLRTFKTTTGLDCSQTGRLMEGKLGDVDDEGRFTESPLRAFGCGGGAPPGSRPGSYGFNALLTNVAASGCALPGERRRDGRPRCTDRNIRTVFNGHFGPELQRVTFADPDGSNLRGVQVSPEGKYVAVVRGLINFDTQPQIRLYFDGGCGPARDELLENRYGAYVKDCQVVVPLDEPRPQPESAASKRARKHPARHSPVRVSQRVAGPGRRISVRFKVPITVGAGDGYTYSLEGPGAKACAAKLPRHPGRTTGFHTMIRGRWTDLLLPLGGKSGHWCEGEYRVRVHFVSGTKTYPSFGSARFRIE